MPENLGARHKGETTVYTTCMVNCGSSHRPILDVGLKDTLVVAAEPDDR